MSAMAFASSFVKRDETKSTPATTIPNVNGNNTDDDDSEDDETKQAKIEQLRRQQWPYINIPVIEMRHHWVDHSGAMITKLPWPPEQTRIPKQPIPGTWNASAPIASKKNPSSSSSRGPDFIPSAMVLLGIDPNDDVAPLIASLIIHRPEHHGALPSVSNDTWVSHHAPLATRVVDDAITPPPSTWKRDNNNNNKPRGRAGSNSPSRSRSPISRSGSSSSQSPTAAAPATTASLFLTVASMDDNTTISHAVRQSSSMTMIGHDIATNVPQLLAPLIDLILQYIPSYLMIGNTYERCGDWSNAFRWWSAASCQALAEDPAMIGVACFKTSLCYRFGMNACDVDETKAAELLQRAVAARVRTAYMHLAEFYAYGKGGVPEDTRIGSMSLLIPRTPHFIICYNVVFMHRSINSSSSGCWMSICTSANG
jgi:hypothetical protein